MSLKRVKSWHQDHAYFECIFVYGCSCSVHTSPLYCNRRNVLSKHTNRWSQSQKPHTTHTHTPHHTQTPYTHTIHTHHTHTHRVTTTTHHPHTYSHTHHPHIQSHTHHPHTQSHPPHTIDTQTGNTYTYTHIHPCNNNKHIYTGTHTQTHQYTQAFARHAGHDDGWDWENFFKSAMFLTKIVTFSSNQLYLYKEWRVRIQTCAKA